ncbi:cathepsin L1-like [Drosophila hydei]|uniref:Cathepsin L1-like n=1 Tax=Drosophila hydei TaxID=7224 RepID=A0A6J1MEQ0_DROHY|nr:cathepsin L1-like [Drosophila hydei]
MRVLLVIVFLVGMACCTLGRATTLEDQLNTEWDSYKNEFDKIYGDESEELLRKLIFQNNKQIIDAHNERWAVGAESYEMGLNQFSDMLPEEISKAIGANDGKEFIDDVEVESYDEWNDDVDFDLELPRNVNWTQMGAVTPVMFQGHFNNSWAFAAAGVTESHQFIKSGHLNVLSKQNLVDCCHAHSHHLAGALLCIKKMKGIDLERSYPYRGLTGKCHFKRKFVGASINKIFQVRPGNEHRLAHSVSKGPVAAVISHAAIAHYKSGVFHNPDCGESPDYAVLIVGYGHCNHFGDYWIVKTSLGPQWGDKGYLKLARNKHNLCGITNWAYYPQMK